MCCKLWEHCSRVKVILPLMRPMKLVQCIEYRGDGYFTWKFPPFFTCMSLLPSPAPVIMDLMVILWSFEEYLSFRLLGRTTLLDFSYNLIQIDSDLSWHIVGTYCPLGPFYSMVPPLRFCIPHRSYNKKYLIDTKFEMCIKSIKNI